jgi:hypothetical protein
MVFHGEFRCRLESAATGTSTNPKEIDKMNEKNCCRMPPYILAGALAFLTALPVSAIAQSTYFIESYKTIARLGAQDTYFYVDFAQPFGQNCAYGAAYIMADKKGLYVQLLAAKLTGKIISGIDYSQPGGNGTKCIVELVEVN